MTEPTLVVEAGFAATPLDALSSITWTTLHDSSDANHRRAREVTVRRGRQHELARFEAAEATVVLTNTDRRFDPTYTSGPYGSTVKPMKRIRIRAHRGAALDCDGTNDYAEAAHHSSLALTGDCTFECWAYFDSFAASNKTLVAKTATSGGVQGAPYDWRVTSAGLLSLRVGNGTASQNLDSTRTLVLSGWYHLATVVSGTSVTHYVDGMPEAALTITQARADTGAVVRVGGRHDGSNLLNGRIDDVRVWNTARTAQQIRSYRHKDLVGTETGLVAYWKMDEGTGTTVADDSPNSNTLTFGAGSAAPTWVTGSSTRPYYVFTGYAESWDLAYAGPNDAICNLRCVDAFKPLNLVAPTKTPYSASVIADSPYLYWRLGETVGTLAADSSGNSRTGTYTGGVTLGEEPMLVGDNNPSIKLGPNLYVDGGSTFSVERTQAWTIECWFNAGDSAQSAFPIVSKYDTATSNRGIRVALDGFGFVQAQIVNTSPSNRILVVSGTPVTDGRDHHLVVTYDGSSTAAGVQIYKDGVIAPMQVSADTLSATIINSGTFRVGTTVSARCQDVAVYTSVLSADRVAAHYAAGRRPWALHRTSERVTALLDIAGWPTADRRIDTGVATMTSQTPIYSILGDLHDVAAAELGGMYVAPDGVIEFAHRYTNILGSESVATYGDAAGEIRYVDLTPTTDDTDLWTQVTATRPGGTPQVLEDATGVAAYGRRNLAVDAAWSDDNQARSVASRWLDRSATPKTRFPSIVVRPVDDNHWTHMFGVNVHIDRITVKRRPPGGGTMSQECWVEGIEHVMRPGSDWTTTLRLIPADTIVAAGGYPVVGTATVGGSATLAL